MTATATVATGGELRLDPSVWDDGQCIEAAQRGDAAGFAQLYARYRPQLLRRARAKWRLAGDLAEDVVHDTWVRAIEHIGGFDRTRQFEPWANRILDNVVIDHLRRTRTGDGSSRQLPLTLSDEMEVGPTIRVSDDERVADREALTRAMAALPARQQQTAVGVLVSGLTLDEAAAELHLSNSACRQLLHRARTSLRRTLLEYGALPGLFPPFVLFRRRVATLARRLGPTEGSALAGTGSTVIAVLLTVTFSVAGAHAGIAGAGERAAEHADARVPAAAYTKAAKKISSDARPALDVRPRGRRAHSERPRIATEQSPQQRRALVAVPAAEVPFTGHGVHQKRPRNPDYDYSVTVTAPGVEVSVGVEAEHRGAAAPAHALACETADGLPQSRCERSRAD